MKVLYPEVYSYLSVLKDKRMLFPGDFRYIPVESEYPHMWAGAIQALDYPLPKSGVIITGFNWAVDVQPDKSFTDQTYVLSYPFRGRNVLKTNLGRFQFDRRGVMEIPTADGYDKSWLVESPRSRYRLHWRWHVEEFPERSLQPSISHLAKSLRKMGWKEKDAGLPLRRIAKLVRHAETIRHGLCSCPFAP